MIFSYARISRDASPNSLSCGLSIPGLPAKVTYWISPLLDLVAVLKSGCRSVFP